MSIIIFVPTIVKYAAEARTYSFNYSQIEEILSGDTITAINSLTESPNDGTLVIGAASINGSKVEAELSAGTSGTTYTLTCIITTSSGAVIEGQGYLQVN